MFEFIIGVGFGIWIGTTYNCKPIINIILQTVKNNINHNEKKNV